MGAGRRGTPPRSRVAAVTCLPICLWLCFLTRQFWELPGSHICARACVRVRACTHWGSSRNLAERILNVGEAEPPKMLSGPYRPPGGAGSGVCVTSSHFWSHLVQGGGRGGHGLPPAPSPDPWWSQCHPFPCRPQQPPSLGPGHHPAGSSGPWWPQLPSALPAGLPCSHSECWAPKTPAPWPLRRG